MDIKTPNNKTDADLHALAEDWAKSTPFTPIWSAARDLALGLWALRLERDGLKIQLTASCERVQMLIDAKQSWIERAEQAEANFRQAMQDYTRADTKLVKAEVALTDERARHAETYTEVRRMKDERDTAHAELARLREDLLEKKLFQE